MYNLLNKNNKKRIAALVLLCVFLLPQLSLGFCGFYVAKTNNKLYNNQSEVILVRDGDKTVLTMSNDYSGPLQDFAIVVPVPTVLQQNDIRIAEQNIFDKINAYSAPRVVEYYDDNPCNEKDRYRKAEIMSNVVTDSTSNIKEKVSIEAKYTVGEYDILILSAQESNALQTWLNTNGYKVPDNANEVLEPYIKSNTKFFVAKVNLKNKASLGYNTLRPLQIQFSSPKFMLPIRLGMANANAAQDVIIYAFTKTGQVECTNYRTVDMPTDLDMPMLIKDDFSEFYKAMFTRFWTKENKNIIVKEYAWDLSGTNYMHCDPCVGEIPNGQDLKQAGVWWLNVNNNNTSYSAGYEEPVFITRLHVRYDREHFPQDLQFQPTQNKQNFQARYILNHAITEPLSCGIEARKYKKMLQERNIKEKRNLAHYAGWHINVDGSVGKVTTEEMPKNIYKASTPNSADLNIIGKVFLFISACVLSAYIALKLNKAKPN
jgi:hypothetical protein